MCVLIGQRVAEVSINTSNIGSDVLSEEERNVFEERKSTNEALVSKGQKSTENFDRKSKGNQKRAEGALQRGSTLRLSLKTHRTGQRTQKVSEKDIQLFIKKGCFVPKVHNLNERQNSFRK